MKECNEQSGRILPNFLMAFCALMPMFITGCVRFEPKPISAENSATRLEERSLTNSELQSFLEKNLGREISAWPPASWDFEMLTLTAFYWNPSLAVARAQLGASQAGEKTAGQRPNPILTVTPGYNSTTPMASPWLPLGFLDMPIETAGKRGYRRAHAAHLSQAARLNIVDTAWQLRGALRSHLLDLEVAAQREALLKKQLDLEEEIVKALEQQLQAGAISGPELFPSRINLLKTRFDLADLERTRAEARARVAEDIGVSTRALNDIKFSFNSNEMEAIAGLTSQEFRVAALQNRADVLGGLAEYAAAQSALQLEIAKQYPDVHLQPGYQFDQGDSKWSLGLVVELPVLNQNQGPIAEAKAHREELAARFTALQAKVIAEIDRAEAILRATQQTVGTVRAMADTLARRRDSIAAQLKAGAIDRVELLNAESEYLTNQLLEIDGKLRFHQAIGALEDALQARFKPPSTLLEPSPADAH